MRWCRWNVSTTCSPSPWRSRRVSTKTHVSCGPTALWTSAAATAESTPPDSAQMTRSPPTCAWMAPTCCSMIDVIVHVGRHPARWCRNWRSTCCPYGVCDTSGWYCTPHMRRLGDSRAATGASAEVAVATKPSGTRAMPSKCDIHTVCSLGWSASKPGTGPPSPADAEPVDLGIERGRALDVDRLGPARQDQRPRPPGPHLCGGDRVGHDLGVDVGLAHPPGYQLRVLRPEVDHEARVELVGGGGRGGGRSLGDGHESTTSSASCRSFTVS